MFSQSSQTNLALPVIKIQRSRSCFTTPIFSNALKRNSSIAPRGVVGEDRTEIAIREAFLRKRAYERECYANGDDGNDVDDDTADEEEMQCLLQELEAMEPVGQIKQMKLPEVKLDVLEEGRKEMRKKSWVARVLSRDGN
ncbi:MAG: hypothetical protein Q9222_001690 [Ikaeria aurantiellina]